MTNLLVGLAILLGIVGTIVPILPGALLVAGAVLIWAFLTGGTTAWLVAIAAVGIIRPVDRRKDVEGWLGRAALGVEPASVLPLAIG